MIKVRLKRIKTGVHFDPTELDRRFTEGTLKTMPKTGDNIVFYFNQLHQGWWVTSTVMDVVRLKTVFSVQTRNSLYHIKKGWNK